MASTKEKLSEIKNRWKIEYKPYPVGLDCQILAHGPKDVWALIDIIETQKEKMVELEKQKEKIMELEKDVEFYKSSFEFVKSYEILKNDIETVNLTD